MKKIYYLLLFALIASLAVSCDDGNSVDRVLELDLTENAITLSDAGQEKFVKVTTDKNNSFEATWNGDAWAKLETSAEGLTIKADENVGAAPRTATVIVVLKQGKNKTEISVTQHGKEAVIGTLPNELWFSQFAGSKELVITTNQSDWKVEVPTSEWATVDVDDVKGIITVGVIENTLEEDRFFDITLTAAEAGLSKKVKVIQTAPLTYIMPYMGFGNPLPDIRAFEENRGSTYNYGRDIYVWKTASQIMPRVHYTLDESNMYFLKMVDSYYKKDLFDLTKYTALLTKEGFEFMFNESTRWGNAIVSWKEPNLISINMEIEDASEGYVIFEERPFKPGNPVQTDPMPTFASYPWGFHTIGSSFDDVKAWEAANGGTIAIDQSDASNMPYITFLTNSSPVIAREYVIAGDRSHPGVTRLISYIDDVSLAMYSASMTNILTHEFKALLESEGWTPLGGRYQPGFDHSFKHAAKDLELKVYDDIARDDLEDFKNKHILGLRITPGSYAPSPNIERPQDDTPREVIIRGHKKEVMMSIRNIK